MCADCLPGYSRDGRGGCKKCGEKGLNILFPVLVGCSILLILFLLVYSTIVKRGGAFDSSDGARKVFISYLQLAGLATTMKIPWPVDYVTLFRIEGMLSSVGEEFLDIRCALETPLPIATIEYYKILGYAIAPFVLVFLSVLGWNTCGRAVERRERQANMVGTIVMLVYLAFPSISAGVVRLWKCEYVNEVGYIFVVDPETLCSDESHQLWRNLLGWPCILLYVFGLPASGLGILYRFRNKLDEPRTRTRFGLLYDGFSRANYLYEGWVALRKLLIIFIGNFTDKLQVQLAIGAVGMLLGHTIYRQPYQTRSLVHLDELLLSCVFFTYWVGGIFTVFPQCQSDAWEAELCKAAQWVVLLFNVACFALGLGMCIWLTWLKKREQLKGSTQSMFAGVSRWRICRPCCRKGLGIWLRASQAEWAINPLEKEVELKEIVRSSMAMSPEEVNVMLKGEIKKLENENKALREENKQLKVGAIPNQLNGKGGSSSMTIVRNPLRGKNNKSLQLKKQATVVDPNLVVELRQLRRQNTADRKERLGRLSALRKAASQGESESQGNVLPKERRSWVKLVDPASGEFYYYNEKSGDTVWDCPVDFEE